LAAGRQSRRKTKLNHGRVLAWIFVRQVGWLAGQGPVLRGHALWNSSKTDKHLIIDLPMGAKEGPYHEVGLSNKEKRVTRICGATGTRANARINITDFWGWI